MTTAGVISDDTDHAGADGGPAPSPPPWRTAVAGAGWTLAFVLSRLVPIALTFAPDLYGDISDPTGDVSRYAGWAEQIVGDGLAPYRETDIEYPPGSLPFVLLPALLGQARFSLGLFVLLLLALDAVAFVMLVRLGRVEGASRRGAVLWLLGPPVLGVLLYARLDMVPSVALLLGLERAHRRHWFTSGVWFGLGAAAKLFPALLLPLALVAAAGRRLRLLAGALLGGLVAWLPFAADTGDLLSDVLGYHSARGIHLESIWGSVLNLRRVDGGPVELVFEYGAFHITGPGADTMLRLTTAMSVAVVVGAVVIAVVRWSRDPDRARTELPLAATVVLALLLGTGRVFSPQFMIWLLAAAAVLCAVLPRLAWWVGPALLVIVVLTAAGYPVAFDLLRDGERWPALVLLYRNIAVNLLGVALLARWLWGDGDAGRRLRWPRR